MSEYSLSPASRIAIGLKILKAGLCPHVIHSVRTAGIDPLTALPPSSPVLKHGFEIDARAALIILKTHLDLFVEPEDMARYRPVIRRLQKLRDLWAHQQTLDENDADAFLKDTALLLNALSRSAESVAAHHLTSAPDTHLLSQIDWIFEVDSEDAPRPYSYEYICAVLCLDNFPADLARLMKALVWEAACAVTTGMAPLAMLIIESDPLTCFPGETGLPSRLFWWVADLPHDASPEDKKARHRDYHPALEANV